MKKKLFKLLLVFTIMMTCFPASIKAKANEDEIIYADLTEELIETLDEFYFQNKSIYFYDQNGILINDYILQLKKDYINDKYLVAGNIGENISSTTKVEDVDNYIQKREAVMPDLGGGGSTYKTKVLTTTVYFTSYASVTFTFTGRIIVGEYVEYIDTNIAYPETKKTVSGKYKDTDLNFSVQFDNYIPCYGNCSYGCSMYAYAIKYRVTLSVLATNNIIRDDQMEKVHAYIYARNYTWFDDYEDFYEGL